MAIKSEYLTLIDMALAKGVDHHQLLTDIKSQIINLYQARFPNYPPDLQITIDSSTGQVSVLSGGTNIADLEFRLEAESLARQIVLRQINSTPTVPPKSKSKLRLSHIIFWSYNLIFASSLIFLGIALITSDSKMSFFESFRSLVWYKQFFLLLTIFTPYASVYYAVKSKLSHQPARLSRFFFLLEAPLLMIATLLSTLSNDSLPILLFFGFNLLLLPFVLYINLDQDLPDNYLLKVVQLFVNFIVLLSLAYLVLLFIFFYPLIVGFVLNFEREMILVPLFSYSLHTNILSFIISFVLTGLLFIGVVAIILLPYLIIKPIVSQIISSVKSIKSAKTILIASGLLYLFFFVISAHQPNPAKFLDALKLMNQYALFEQKQDQASKLLSQKDDVRRALLDLINAQSRYLWTKDQNVFSSSYQDLFNMDSNLADSIQSLFYTLAYPFVYQYSSLSHQDAQTAYQYVFGQTLVEDPNSPTPAAVNLSSRRVEATTDSSALLATITVTEEYANTTYQNQEIIYEFSLPNQSTITDLLLGPNLEFTGIISPRGAAQATYQAQLQVNRDPALIEQTGPRQYRLRVFPIPSKTDIQHQKVSFTYVTPRQQSGFGLPVYTKHSNLNPDSNQISYFLDGSSINPSQNLLTDHKNICQLISSQPDLTSTTESFDLVYQPNCNLDLSSPKNLKLAILFDSSSKYSTSQWRYLTNTLKSNPDFVANNSVDFYFFNDLLSQPHSLTSTKLTDLDLVNFGPSQPFQVITDLKQSYDLVILFVSDHSQVPDQVNLTSSSPLYFIFADDKIPAFPQTLTEKLLQNRSRIISDLPQALSIFTTQEQLSTRPQTLPLSTNPYWSITYTHPAALSAWPSLSASHSQPFSFILADTFIQTQIALNQQTSDISYLDQLHAFASANHVVTPYSSLIALVNQQQLDQLKDQSASDQRYEERPAIVNRPPRSPSILLNSISFPSGGGGFSSMGILSSPSINTFSSLSKTTASSLLIVPLVFIQVILVLIGTTSTLFFKKFKKTV